MTAPRPQGDLTRWNRAGLSRVGYVDANAITLLDRLLEQVRERFGPEWDPAPPDAPDAVARYLAAPHGDAGWELLRALARAAHVLTAHLDAYANETLLATATQPEFLRGLVRLLDHQPAPAASATTTLVLEVSAPVAVPAGSALRHQPPDGPAVVFETLAAVAAEPACNALRPAGATRNPAPLPHPFTLDRDRPLVVGDPVVLVEGARRHAARITAVARDQAERPVLTVAPPPSGFTVGGTTVHSGPKDRIAVRGPQAQATPGGTRLRVAKPASALRRGDVAWIDRPDGVSYHRVEGAVGFAVDLQHDPGPVARGATVGLALPVAVATAPDETVIHLRGDWTWLEGTRIAVGRVDGRRRGEHVPDKSEFLGVVHVVIADGVVGRPPSIRPTELATVTVTGAALVRTADEDGVRDVRNGTTRLTLDTNPGFAPQWAFVPPRTGTADGLPVDPPLRHPSGTGLPTSVRTGKVTRAEAGDWVVLADAGDITVARATSVVASGGGADVTVDIWSADGTFHTATTAAVAGFAAATTIADAGRNDSPVEGTVVQLADVPAVLAIGRPVVLEHLPLDGPPAAVGTRVLVVHRGDEPPPGTATVTFADPVPPGSTAGSLVVRGNAAPAGHGESQPAAVLGSGSGDRIHQRFTVPVPAGNGGGCSTVPDPAFPSGVRLDVELTVAGRRWVQVPALREAGPDAHCFEVRPGEDGQPVVRTGDGMCGRRLPTGRDNVVGRWRVGADLRGNLPAGRLTELVRPIPGVDAVRQPMPAAGGGDGDDVEAIRTTAPRSVLALDRAVSLADLQALAAARADVWQAWSHRLPGGRRGAVVEVVVVPAGGGELPASQRSAVQAALTAASPPGCTVHVRGHRPVPLHLQVRIAVRSEAFDLEAARRATLDRLGTAFSARSRRLGQRITREEVVLVAEQIAAVENAVAVIGEATAAAAVAPNAVVRDGSGAVRLVLAEPDQLIALDQAGSALTVVPAEYTR